MLIFLTIYTTTKKNTNSAKRDKNEHGWT